jgi:predicted RND superfamily exporter protein
MLLTTLTVSVGFLSLLFSQFLALKYLGLLIGVSLFTAVFADLFLSPVLLRFFRPRIPSGMSGERSLAAGLMAEANASKETAP